MLVADIDMSGDSILSDISSGTARPQPSGLRRGLSWILVAAAIVYLGYFLYSQWQALEEELARIRLGTLLAAMAATLLMLALKSAYHVLTFRRLGQSSALRASRIAGAYAASQVIRYLPGKILGVVYEANQLAPQSPAQRVVAVNIMQGLYTSALTVGILCIAAGWYFSDLPVLGIFLIGLTLTMLWAAHRLHLTERLIFWAAKLVPRLRRIDWLPIPSSKASLLASIVLFAEWVPYFFVWALLAPGDGIVLNSAILLGLCYAGASLAANFAVVAPSGLFLREAIFLWVGSQLSLDPAILIVLGMLSRLIFTLADLVFVPLVWGWEMASVRIFK